ncbi:MAG: asparagine synthetase B family protein [Planctomycetes bacterium]|nr:asparagine synthetase B family protein [Planctomycetota bacterium]
MNSPEPVNNNMTYQTIAKIENLMDPSGDFLLNMSFEEAQERVRSGDGEAVREIDGQFAICCHEGRTVRMARSIGRPMRYFLAKQADGPCLLVAETMEQIQRRLEQLGLGDQFHPSYTRMVPAHYVVEIELVGCPDPNPKYNRFLNPTRNRLPADLDAIGKAYIEQIVTECNRWLATLDDREPIGVLFSGGIDSGSILIILNYLILERGQAPTRLKAFTLGTDDDSLDASQAHAFLSECGLTHLWEFMRVSPSALDWRQAVRWIEDYKPLDVQSATMAIALCQAIRNAYPSWKFLVDGDGGDENLKDYPIEDNPELTIRSVLNNLMLYHEGWGVHAIKHSLVYSGGQSRGHVRTWAPAHRLGFSGFSPMALPSVIEVSEGIPFIELTQWDHGRLYELKGEVVRRGIKQVTGVEMPVYPKRRFQRGAISEPLFAKLFPKEEREYRDAFLSQFS